MFSEPKYLLGARPLSGGGPAGGRGADGAGSSLCVPGTGGGRSRLWLVCGRFSPGICPRLSAPFPDGATGRPAAGDAGRQSAGRSHFCRAFPGGKYRDCRGAGDHRRDECPLFSCLLHHALSETGPSAGWKPREKVPEVGVGMKVEEGLQESYRKRLY